MRAVLLPMWLICTTASVAMAQEDDTTPVYDFGDVGGVVVYDTGAAPARGRTTVQSDYGAADGEYWFYGPHPDGQGAWCAAEGAHSHEYPPFDEYLFTQENGYYYFIGDPADFGYANNDNLYGYYGEHPIALAYGGGYCYYDGYHHHWWPAWGSYFVVTDGWYLYNGPFSPWFWSYRDRYNDYFHNVYPSRRITIARPVTYGHPPARQPAPRQHATFNPPVQRLRTPAAPARTGWGYVAPPRPVVMRPAMPAHPVHSAPARLVPAAHPVPAPRPTAPVHYAPARSAPAPARAAPAAPVRRH